MNWLCWLGLHDPNDNELGFSKGLPCRRCGKLTKEGMKMLNKLPLVLMLLLSSPAWAELDPESAYYGDTKMKIHYANYNRGPSYSSDYDVLNISKGYSDDGEAFIELRCKPNQAIYIPLTPEFLAVLNGRLEEYNCRKDPEKSVEQRLFDLERKVYDPKGSTSKP